MTDEITIPEEVSSLKHHKWRLFVLAYVGAAMGNAAEAARLAGYATKSAKVTACNLMKRQEIIQAVDALAERVNKAHTNRDTKSRIADADEVHAFLASVMRAEVGDVVLCKDGFPVTDPATGEYVTVTKVRDRTKAGETLLRARGEFLDRKEVTIRHELQGANLLEIRDRLEAKLAEVNALILAEGIEVEGEVVGELTDGEAA